MVDPRDKEETIYIKDQSTDTEWYLEYANKNEKGKVNQLDVGKNNGQHNKTKAGCEYKTKSKDNIILQSKKVNNKWLNHSIPKTSKT